MSYTLRSVTVRLVDFLIRKIHCHAPWGQITVSFVVLLKYYDHQANLKQMIPVAEFPRLASAIVEKHWQINAFISDLRIAGGFATTLAALLHAGIGLAGLA